MSTAGRSGPGRSLAWYLILPRPVDFLFKLPFVCGGTVLGWLSAPAGQRGVTAIEVLLFVVAFEFCVYQARYQWNDIRGFAEDQRHPHASARGRLPGPLSARRRRYLASGSVAAARLLVAAGIAIAVLPPRLGRELILSAVLVFVIAAGYEWVRAQVGRRPVGGRSALTQRRLNALLYGWIGAGYALRLVTGLAVGTGGHLGWLAAGSAAVASAAFGTMFVTMVWLFDGVSYLRAGEPVSPHSPALRHKPHLAELLTWVADPDPGGPWEPAPTSSELAPSARRLLSGRQPAAAPWRRAFSVAVVASGVLGLTLADSQRTPVRTDLTVTLAATAVVAALGGRLRPAVCAALAVLAVVLGGAMLQHRGASAPWLGGLPVAGTLAAYAGFRNLSTTRLQRGWIRPFLGVVRQWSARRLHGRGSHPPVLPPSALGLDHPFQHHPSGQSGRS